MSLQEFVASVWSENEDELKDIEELKNLLDQLQRRDTEIYIVSIHSNQ